MALIMMSVGIFGCDDIVELEDISNTTVVLSAPFNGAALQATSLNFSWEPITDANSYHLQIATPNFETPIQIMADSILTSNNFTIDLEANSYQWRVNAKNSGYQTNYTTQSFTIEE